MLDPWRSDDSAQWTDVKLYYVYFLQCFDGTIYVGVTGNIERRIGEHRAGVDRECYTYNRRPLKVIHVSEFHWVHDAVAFEKQTKKWSHRKKRAFAQGKRAHVTRYAKNLTENPPPAAPGPREPSGL